MGVTPPGPTEASPGGATEISDETMFDDFIATEDRLLVEFYADWCGPCLMMAPVLDEFADETDVAVAKVDVEEAPQIAARYDVQSIPTLIVFQQGAPEQRLVGMKEKAELERAVRE